jgi:hypothetical protein
VAVAVSATLFIFTTGVPQTAPPQSHTNQTKRFMTAEQAFKLIPDKFFPSHVGRNTTSIFQFSQPQFLFLKYNGTTVPSRFTNMSYPSFVAYAANSTTSSIDGKIGSIYFDGTRGKLFANSTQDKYVWSFDTEHTIPSITRTYVNAETGAIVGFYNPCPDCVWKPYLEKNFYP